MSGLAVQDSIADFGTLALEAIRELQRECRERDETIALQTKTIEELTREVELYRLHLRQTQDPRER